jgi:hypothetical protein
MMDYSLCEFCKHQDRGLVGWPRCKAFPDEIPLEVLTTEHDHREPYPGDGGIRFELDPELDEGLVQQFRHAFGQPER